MSIHVLDDVLANQIAAGEVVERPASVIKELVENSIDAGATEVSVDIEHGGAKLIRVRDNGQGIEKDDLSLALLAHATSKIATLEDLFSVESLGFRGEALASIAAVSRLKLTSKQAMADQAWRIESFGAGQTEPVVPAAHPQGTTIEVVDLFFNTPARKKFMRTDNTEFRHIETMLSRLALGHMSIAFKLTHNGKTIYQLPVATTETQQEHRVAKILGDRFMAHALALESEASGMRLTGWVALPEYNRSQMDQQYFYLNGRYVRDKMLSRALKQAYHDVMFHGRFAAYILYLEVDPTTVDVNVHPTKSEVRFRDGRSLFQFLVQAVKAALAQSNLGVGHVDSFDAPPVLMQSPQENYQGATAELQTEPMSAMYRPQPAATATVQHQVAMDLIHQSTVSDGDDVLSDIKVNSATEETPQSQHAMLPRDYMRLGNALAQLHDIYILAQNDQGLIVVDMHAGHERVQYERLKRDLSAQRLLSQALLLPVSVSLHPEEMHAFLEFEQEFRRLAIVAEVSGPDSIMVREVPLMLKDADIVQLMHDLLADILVQQSSTRVDDLIHILLATMACKSAIKAHHRLSLTEMNALLRDMEKTPHGGLCNHGRPAWKQIAMKEIDRWFLRGQ